MNVTTRVASDWNAATIRSIISRTYSWWSDGIPGSGAWSVSVSALSLPSATERRSENSIRRSRARIDSKYSSRRTWSVRLAVRRKAFASWSTASITERLLAPPDGGRKMRSKTARGSTSRGSGRSGADHEMLLRDSELEKKPSPFVDSSSDGSSVACPTCRPAIWSADTPPALTACRS